MDILTIILLIVGFVFLIKGADFFVEGASDLATKLKLRSNYFEIIKNENTLTITTKGYGHGVGMSQYGARILAKEGSDYKSILKYYYTGVEIKG